MNFMAHGVASENCVSETTFEALRGFAQGRKRSVARLRTQPCGTGPIFPVSLSFVTRRFPIFVAPLSSIQEKLAPVAAHHKVHNSL